MIYLRIFFYLLISMSILAACQPKEEATQTQQKAEEKTDSPVEASPEVSLSEQTKSDFVEQVKPGMTEQEVRTIFGSDFKLLVNAMEGNETWRYDIGKQEGYSFDDQGIDQVDLEGLKAGQVQQLLFMDWNEAGKLKSAALFMRSEDGAAFTEFRIMEDGSMEENHHPF